MATLQVDDIADMIVATKPNFDENKWTDLTSNLQEYHILPRILKKNANSNTFSSGRTSNFQVQIGTSGAAKMTGLYGTVQANRNDSLKSGTVPFRHAITNWSIDRREITMNQEPARIVDEMAALRHDAIVDMAKLLEIQGWNAPASSSDEDNLWGIFYWIVPSLTAAVGQNGFNGGRPTGFTDCGGIDPNVFTQWRNWTDLYTDVSKTDLIDKIRAALHYCEFKPPVPSPGQNVEAMSNFQMYTAYPVLRAMEILAEAQNENLGDDLASKDGMVTIRRVAIDSVTYLDSNPVTSGGILVNQPVVGINWNWFNAFFLEGEYMREERPYNPPYQPTVYQTDIFLTCNFRCRNRRANFIINHV